jgi:outer membrane receptor protein involved in Fe transport
MPTPRWTVSLRGQGAWQRSWGFRRAYYDYFGHDPDTRLQPPFDLGQPGQHRLPPLYQLDASLAYARDVGPVTLQARLEVLNVTGRANVTDWRLAWTGTRWTKASRHLYPRLPSLVLRAAL